MLNLFYILLIIVEIAITVFCVKKLIMLEKEVKLIDEKVKLQGEKIVETIKQTRQVIGKINKVVSFLTSRKFNQIKRIIVMGIEIFQLVMLIRSLKFAKGMKFVNFQNAKKIFFAGATQHLIRKIISFV